jgi:FixJ family two-component response regulator
MRKPPTRIAVVDDDASIRKALARMLAASSFDVETYGSARDFLDSLELGPPDCLIVDLRMPDVSGLDLQRDLARTDIKIPTIVITGHDEPGLRERCRSAGAVAFLLKPLDPSTLIGMVNLAMAR